MPICKKLPGLSNSLDFLYKNVVYCLSSEEAQLRAGKKWPVVSAETFPFLGLTFFIKDTSYGIREDWPRKKSRWHPGRSGRDTSWRQPHGFFASTLPGSDSQECPSMLNTLAEIYKKSSKIENWSPDIFICMQGIYKIVHRTSGKYYVGSSKNIYGRWTEHKLDLKKKIHDNKHLQSAWELYGPDAFDFVPVEEVLCSEYSKLLEVEQKYLNIAKNEKSKVYNMKFTAVGGWDWSNGNLLASLRRGKTHKDYSHDVHEFKNETTGEAFKGTRCDFYTKYGLMKHHVRELVRGKRKSVKGWTVPSNPPKMAYRHDDVSKEKMREVWRSRSCGTRIGCCIKT